MCAEGAGGRSESKAVNYGLPYMKGRVDYIHETKISEKNKMAPDKTARRNDCIADIGNMYLPLFYINFNLLEKI